jgi:phosphoglycolate phosphatase
VKLCLEKMSPSRVNGIIFDFDYTLADSSHGVVECINYALENLGLPAVSAEEACRTIGLSLPNTFLTLTGQEQRASSDEFVRLFIKRADEVMADMTVLFEAVPQTVRLLKKRGHKLGIVSTKFRYRIETILKREGLSDVFDVVIGGEDVANHKPDPEGLQMALDRLGCSLVDSLYVGDSFTDAETAQRANVPFAAVLSGTTPRDAFNGYSVYKFLESVSELPHLLKVTEERTTDK